MPPQSSDPNIAAAAQQFFREQPNEPVVRTTPLAPDAPIVTQPLDGVTTSVPAAHLANAAQRKEAVAILNDISDLSDGFSTNKADALLQKLGADFKLDTIDNLAKAQDMICGAVTEWDASQLHLLRL